MRVFVSASLCFRLLLFIGLVFCTRQNQATENVVVDDDQDPESNPVTPDVVMVQTASEWKYYGGNEVNWTASGVCARKNLTLLLMEAPADERSSEVSFLSPSLGQQIAPTGYYISGTSGTISIDIFQVMRHVGRRDWASRVRLQGLYPETDYFLFAHEHNADEAGAISLEDLRLADLDREECFIRSNTFKFSTQRFELTVNPHPETKKPLTLSAPWDMSVEFPVARVINVRTYGCGYGWALALFRGKKLLTMAAEGDCFDWQRRGKPDDEKALKAGFCNAYAQVNLYTTYQVWAEEAVEDTFASTLIQLRTVDDFRFVLMPAEEVYGRKRLKTLPGSCYQIFPKFHIRFPDMRNTFNVTFTQPIFNPLAATYVYTRSNSDISWRKCAVRKDSPYRLWKHVLLFLVKDGKIFAKLTPEPIADVGYFQWHLPSHLELYEDRNHEMGPQVVKPGDYRILYRNFMPHVSPEEVRKLVANHDICGDTMGPVFKIRKDRRSRVREGDKDFRFKAKKKKKKKIGFAAYRTPLETIIMLTCVVLALIAIIMFVYYRKRKAERTRVVNIEQVRAIMMEKIVTKTPPKDEPSRPKTKTKTKSKGNGSSSSAAGGNKDKGATRTARRLTDAGTKGNVRVFQM